MTTTLKTTVHTYRFDTRNATERDAWQTLRNSLRQTHPHCMESHGGALHYQPALDGIDVELEPACLFDNQWNTAPIGDSTKGLRLFDWALDYHPHGNAAIKQGHYLDQTPEMREIRRNTHKCGYCGAMEPAAKGYVFCPHCIGSEYLKPEDLKLTRMRPVDECGPSGKFADLTDAERAHLMPQYLDAQLHGNTERDKRRIAKARADVLDKYAKATSNATTERDGMLWLMDNGIRTDNVIYYTHTGRFGFGWRTPYSGELLSILLDKISEFPFEYDITRADAKAAA
jgi:hypothetical protein